MKKSHYPVVCYVDNLSVAYGLNTNGPDDSVTTYQPQGFPVVLRFVFLGVALRVTL